MYVRRSFGYENRPVSLSFEQQLLAEQIRALEETQGAEPAVAVPSDGKDFFSWLRLRNQQLQQKPHIAAALHQAPVLFRRLLIGVCLIAALGGAITSIKALSNAGSELNIFWVLGVLLGLSWLSLLLWAVTLLLNRDHAAGVVAPLFSGLLNRFMPAREKPTAAQAASRIWLQRHFFSPAGTARFGWITHTIWSAYLAGGVIGLLLLFTTRQFDFVWESTLLGGGSFVQLTEILKMPLQVLGLPVPDATQVIASRIDIRGADAGEIRRVWALFLLGCVVIYGLLPRLLVGGICWLVERRLQARMELDATQPYYVRLQREFWPKARQGEVLDPDQHKPQPVAAENISAAVLPGNCVWLGLELPRQFALPEMAKDLINIRDEATFQLALRHLQQHQRLPVALLADGNRAVDRGMQRVIIRLAESVGPRNLWLVIQPAPIETGRQGWMQTAARAGLTPEQVNFL